MTILASALARLYFAYAGGWALGDRYTLLRNAYFIEKKNKFSNF